MIKTKPKYSPAYFGVLILLGVGLAFLPFWGLMIALAAGIVLFVSFAFGIRLNQIDVFSPYVIFPVLWIACVVVGSRIISVEQVPWNDMVWICSVGALFFFILGLLAGDWFLAGFRDSEPERKKIIKGRWNGQKLFILMAAWMTAAFLCMMYEFKYYVGGIPLFNRSWELIRLWSPGGYLSRMIHLLAYSFMLQAIVLQVYIYSQKKLFRAQLLPFWVMLVFALGCAALWGSRHTLFIPLAAGIVAFHYLHKRLKFSHLIILGIIASIFIGGVGFIRKISYFEQRDQEYEEILWNIGYEAKYPVLDQIHNTVAVNFETFRQLTETFPDFHPHTYGKLTFFAFYGLLPGRQETLGQMQNRIWNTGFYGNLTSTYMGVPYVDFGFLGVAVFTLVFAFFIRLLYQSMKQRPTIFNVMLFSYFSYHMILMPYDNTLTKLNLIFDLLILYFVNMIVRERAARKQISEKAALAE